MVQNQNKQKFFSVQNNWSLKKAIIFRLTWIITQQNIISIKTVSGL